MDSKKKKKNTCNNLTVYSGYFCNSIATELQKGPSVIIQIHRTGNNRIFFSEIQSIKEPVIDWISKLGQRVKNDVFVHLSRLNYSNRKVGIKRNVPQFLAA